MILKKAVFYLVLVIAGLSACDDGYLPEGYWPYQVEYMLTDGDSKNWLVTEWVEDDNQVVMTSCTDSLRFAFAYITSDSIASYELRKIGDCVTYDTTFLGELTASGGSGYFTDSLYVELSNGTINRYFMKSLTSSFLNMEFVKSGRKTGVVATQE